MDDYTTRVDRIDATLLSNIDVALPQAPVSDSTNLVSNINSNIATRRSVLQGIFTQEVSNVSS